MIEDTNERYILSLVDRQTGVIMGAVTLSDPSLLTLSLTRQSLVRRMLRAG